MVLNFEFRISFSYTSANRQLVMLEEAGITVKTTDLHQRYYIPLDGVQLRILCDICAHCPRPLGYGADAVEGVLERYADCDTQPYPFSPFAVVIDFK